MFMRGKRGTFKLELSSRLNRQQRRRRLRPATVLQQECMKELEAYSGMLGLATLEGLALWLYEEAALCVSLCDPLWLARRLKIRTRPSGSTKLMGDLLLYEASRDARLQGLRVFHELAHWILKQWFPTTHDHHDVWVLTIILAFPHDDLRLICSVRNEGWTVRTLMRHQRHAERWVLALRIEIGRELYRQAA